MWRIAQRVGWAAIVAASACERPAPARSNDTVAPPPPPPETTATPVVAAPPAWDTAAGAIFLVPGANGGVGAVVLPGIDSAVSLDTVRFDTAPYRTMSLDLFRGGRRVAGATVGTAIPMDVPDECSGWPVVGLGGDSSAATGWTVAFRADYFKSLGIDSIGDLPRVDSLRLASEVARIASAAPGDTVEALRGLPFVVRRAWRTVLPDGAAALVAEVGRALNQEANPVQEHLLILAERDSASSRYRLAYVERAAGTEEVLESVEVLALGVARGRPQPVLLVARYLGDGVVYSLIERMAAGRWRLRWSSPYAGC